MVVPIGIHDHVEEAQMESERLLYQQQRRKVRSEENGVLVKLDRAVSIALVLGPSS